MNCNQQYINQHPLSHDSQPIPLRRPSYPGLIWGQEESRMHGPHSKLDTFIRKLSNACTGRSSIGRSLTPLRMANTLQQHSSGC
jgi:hypothetical protein